MIPKFNKFFLLICILFCVSSAFVWAQHTDDNCTGSITSSTSGWLNGDSCHTGGDHHKHKTYSCSGCSYYEVVSVSGHNQAYNSWTSISDTEHKSTCDSCGAFYITEAHAMTWSGLTYECTKCDFKDTGATEAAKEKSKKFGEAKTEAEKVASPAGTAETESGTMERETKDGDSDYDDAVEYEGIAGQNVSDAKQQVTDANNEQKGVDDFEDTLTGDEGDHRHDVEDENQQARCSLCGEKLLAGNPVNVVSGAKVEQFTDLEIPGEGVHIEIIRNYNNQNENALSLGQGWSFNYDSRIVFGAKLRAQESYDLVVESLADARQDLRDANTYISNADTAYGNAISSYGQAETHYDNAKTAKENAWAALVEAEGKLNKALEIYNAYKSLGSPLSECQDLVNAKDVAYDAIYNTETGAKKLYDDAKDLYDKIVEQVYDVKKSSISACGGKVTSLTTERSTFNTVTAPQIRWDINAVITYLDIEDDRIYDELVVANAQKARNKYVIDPGRREKELFGNGYVSWIDPLGVERLFQADIEVNPDSTAALSDGEKNVWPQTTAFTPLYGREWQMSMTAGGALTVWSDDSGKTYDYNEYGQLTRIEDRDGNFVSLIYENGNLKKITDRYGRYVSVAVNDDGRITDITDFSGRSVSYGYDGRYLSTYRDAGLYSYTYGYDKNGNLNYVENPDTTSRSYVYGEYDGVYKVVDEYDELREHQYFSYSDGLTVHTDRRGFSTSYYISDSYHIEKVVYPDNRVVEEQFNTSGDRITHINSAGYPHSFTPDSKGNVKGEILVSGGEVTREFHPVFDLPTKEELRGTSWKSSTVIQYIESGNGAGRPESVTYTDPVTGELNATLTARYSYDDKGRVLNVTDISGETAAYQYVDKYPLSGSTVTITKNGISSVMTLDSLGRVIEYSQGDSLFTYKYDDLGRIKKVSETGDQRLRITDYEYNYHGVTKITGPYYSTESSGFYKEFEYTKRREAAVIREVEGTVSREISFRYDAEGNLEYRKNADGTESYMTYDRGGKLESTGYYKGGLQIETRRYTYDSAGRIKSARQDGVDQVGYSYPDANTVVENRYGGELTVTRYSDDFGRPVKVRYSSVDGYREEVFQYDYLGRVVGKTIDQDGETGSESYKYDLKGRIVESTDLRGEAASIAYDDPGRKKTITAPGDIVYEYAFDINGRLLSTGDQVKGYTVYTYDDFGRVETVVYPETTTESFIYDARDRISDYTDNRGNLSSIIYGELGTYQTVTNHLQQEWKTEFYIGGQVSAQIGPRGERVEYSYDPYTGAVSKVLGAEGEETRYEYDDLGYLSVIRKIGEEDERLTRYLHDDYGRLTTMLGEEGYTIGYDYDYNGRLRKMTQGSGSLQKTLREWDYGISGIPEAERYTLDGIEYSRVYDYDLAGVLEGETNFRGQFIDYEYDAAGRLDTLTFPDGSFYDYDYDGMSNISHITGPDEYEVSYLWDKEGRLLSEDYPKTGESLVYAYNTYGDLSSISGPGSHDTQKYSYDSLGRMTKVLTTGSDQVSFAYDNSSNLTRVEYGSSDRTVSDYFYDMSNRMTGYRSVKSWGDHEQLIDGFLYYYDKYGDVVFQTDKDGRTTRYRYDGMDRLYQVWYPGASGKNQSASRERRDLGLGAPAEDFVPEYTASLTDIGGIEEYLAAGYEDVFGSWSNKNAPFLQDNYHFERFSYDVYGRRSERTNGFGTVPYAYDSQDRLTRAGNRVYDYDADGNRIKEYFTDTAWEISDDSLNVRVEESTLFIPGKGNGVGQWKNNDPNPHSRQQETWSSYEYRPDNRMVTYKDSQGEHWEYRYDGLGRRYEKERYGSAHPTKDVWRYDRIWYAGTSHSVLAETTDVETWNDKTIQTGLKYLLGPGGRAYAGEEVYMRNGKLWNPQSWSNRRYYHYDRLGSVTALSLDKPGVAGEYYEYGPFGEILKGTHRWGWEHNGNYHMGFDSVGFTGTRIDAESGNYHFPFREYDPLTAQWTTSDPIKDGELWYGYVNSNPIRYVDPLGLESHTCYTVQSGDSYLNIARNLMNSTGREWLQGLVTSSRNSDAKNHADAYRIVKEVSDAIENSLGGAVLQPGQEIELQDIGYYVPRFALPGSSTTPAVVPTPAPAVDATDLSIAGAGFITDFEKYEKNIYDDGYGYKTVGYGHLIQPGEDFSAGLTKNEAIALFKKDTKRFIDAVNDAVTVTLSQNEFDALVSFAFNIGVSGFKNSNVVAAINAGMSNAEIRRRLYMWKYSAGELSNGLVNRRKDEWELFLNGDYERDH